VCGVCVDVLSNEGFELLTRVIKGVCGICMVLLFPFRRAEIYGRESVLYNGSIETDDITCPIVERLAGGDTGPWCE